VQQQHLLLGAAAGTLDDGRHDCATFVLPARQALEAVDDLERTIADGNDSNRQIPNL